MELSDEYKNWTKFQFYREEVFNLNLLVSAYRVASYAELYSSGRVRGAFVATIYTNVANF